MNFLSRRIDALVGQVPEPCQLCAAHVSVDGLCEGCQQDLPRLPATHCPICAVPTGTADLCGQCLKRMPAFDTVRAAFVYTFPIDRLIQRLKFGGALAVSRLLGGELLAAIDASQRPDMVIPMPLSKQRLRERGFNQASEIARPLMRALNIDLDTDACERLRHTPPQMGLTLAQRRANLRDAFHCRRALGGAKIAVVDDVMTSGATLEEVARTLKRAGALRVSGWIVARTPPSGEA